MNKKSK